MTQAAFFAAALLLALWSAVRALQNGSARRTGEIVWTLVAAMLLVAVSAAVRLGSGHAV